QRLKEAGERLQADLTAMELQGDEEKGKVEDVKQLKGLLEKVQTTRALGRLVIDVERLVANDAQQDVILQNGDMLMIPATPQSVSVIGEVQYATSHLYESNLSVEDYIAHSGGITRKADDDKIYVVKANGSVWLPEKSSWFGSSRVALEPGDTIVVPLEVDRLNKLELWTNVSQVFYQIALGAAAVGSL